MLRTKSIIILIIVLTVIGILTKVVSGFFPESKKGQQTSVLGLHEVPATH